MLTDSHSEKAEIGQEEMVSSRFMRALKREDDESKYVSSSGESGESESDFEDEDGRDDDSHDDEDIPPTQPSSSRQQETSRQQAIRRRGDWKKRMKMVAAKARISVSVPPIGAMQFEYWNDADMYVQQYMRSTLSNYRIRSSRSRDWWKTHKHEKVPSSYETVERSFWCTHGCTQPIRGNGQRKHTTVRYTGCPARFIMRVSKVRVNDVMQWRICVVVEVRNSINIISNILINNSYLLGLSTQPLPNRSNFSEV